MVKLEPVDPVGSLASGEFAPSWRITTPDGRELLWDSFHTGPVVLPPEELHSICDLLLGVPWCEIATLSRVELQPYAAALGARPALILYSATPLKKNFEADLDCLRAGKPVDHPAVFVETRSVNLGRVNDLLIGRTTPWRQAAAVSAAEAVVVPGIEYYYLTHALLKQAVSHQHSPSPAISRIVEWLRDHPGCIVRVYSLDTETQLLLLWLKRAAGLERLAIDMNGPDILEQWSQKASLHPAIRDALALSGEDGRDPFGLLEAESRLTPLFREFGVLLDRLPGYTIAKAAADEMPVESQVREAARLLRERYHLRLGCLKPAKATAGARITTNVALDDQSRVDLIVRQAMETDEDYVLEAQAEYLHHSITGYDFILAPSMHIVAGQIAEGASLQFMSGTTWQGNVYVDELTCEGLGIRREQYDVMRRGITALLDAFTAEGRNLGLVKGGIDFAIARVGGRFGDAVLVGMQDLNLCSTGAEYMRMFLDEARAALSGDPQDRRETYVATKVVRPTVTGALPNLQALTDRRSPSYYARTITSVPGRWGLLAVGCGHPVEAAECVLSMERRLRQAELVL